LAAVFSRGPGDVVHWMNAAKAALDLEAIEMFRLVHVGQARCPNVAIRVEPFRSGHPRRGR